MLKKLEKNMVLGLVFFDINSWWEVGEQWILKK